MRLDPFHLLFYKLNPPDPPSLYKQNRMNRRQKNRRKNHHTRGDDHLISSLSVPVLGKLKELASLESQTRGLWSEIATCWPGKTVSVTPSVLCWGYGVRYSPTTLCATSDQSPIKTWETVKLS